ncbi:GntR family transcriptional regulator [Arthrobacter castelli]|uniref:GntR family transcriptional regulator n=1 Tax=Arthrobacter castelli TaxID=271431 RepID=UPI000684E53E|nr:GntR family transcriptional regulator [Arthrobacter castelli]
MTSNGVYRHKLPLREIVSGEIRTRILNGVYPPGSRLVERDLADEFEVSRFPVREALRILTQEGFVENLPTRGIVVKQLNRREVEEIFDLREALEGLASRLAAKRVASGEVNALESLVESSRKALLSGDLDTAHQSNSAFHDEIISFSGNETLQDILGPLMGRLHWIFRQVSDFERVCREHETLREAIDSGDPDRAAAEAERHVLSYRTRTLEYLFS